MTDLSSIVTNSRREAITYERKATNRVAELKTDLARAEEDLGYAREELERINRFHDSYFGVTTKDAFDAAWSLPGIFKKDGDK